MDSIDWPVIWARITATGYQILLIIVLLAWLYFQEDPEPVPAEESFIAEPVGALREAEQFGDEYKTMDEQRKNRLEDALEEQSGGGG